MRILLVRHAKAGDRRIWAESTQKDDAERPLTQKGIDEFSAILPFVRQCIDDLPLILTSPLVRTRQTADLMAKTFDEASVINEDRLMQGTALSLSLQAALDHQNDHDKIAIVGHEAHISKLLAKILKVKDHRNVAFKKGACAYVDYDVHERLGRLLWMIKPKMFCKEL